MIKRRHFMLGLAGLGGVVGILGWRIIHATQEDAVITILHKRLDYLKLDDAGVRQFARDFVAKTAISGGKLRLIAAFSPLYRRLVLSPDNFLSHATRFGEERVVTRYLLSSDFFTTGADETRTVHYVDFFDPMRACGNPFARPVLESRHTTDSA
jgi:hypothetical protein